MFKRYYYVKRINFVRIIHNIGKIKLMCIRYRNWNVN